MINTTDTLLTENEKHLKTKVNILTAIIVVLTILLAIGYFYYTKKTYIHRFDGVLIAGVKNYIV